MAHDENAGAGPAGPTPEPRCAECGRIVRESEHRVETEDGVFCDTCFANLRGQLEQTLRSQSDDVPYSQAAFGGVVGASLGVGLWWGFTVVTNVSFGIVAIVIGFATGKGVAMLSGGKRAVGLQALSAGIAATGFFYATYLVNRTFIHRAFAEEGSELVLPFLPEPQLFLEVVKAGFGVMDVVFLAIVVWEAWKIPAPVRLHG